MKPAHGRSPSVDALDATAHPSALIGPQPHATAHLHAFTGPRHKRIKPITSVGVALSVSVCVCSTVRGTFA